MANAQRKCIAQAVQGATPSYMSHMQNLKTTLTSSLGRFRGSGDGVKNIFLVVFKIWESFSYG